jgi:hypothetical protein
MIPQGLAAFSSVFALVILRTDTRLVRRLRDAGATTSAGALPIEPRHAIQHWRLARLERVGAVHRGAAPGSVFLDEEGWRAWRRVRRRRMLVAVGLAIAVMFVFFRLR